MLILALREVMVELAVVRWLRVVVSWAVGSEEGSEVESSGILLVVELAEEVEREESCDCRDVFSEVVVSREAVRVEILFSRVEVLVSDSKI